MQWNDNSKIKDRHAFLSPSSYHWVNYDLDKMQNRWKTAKAAARGTELHDLAHRLIRLGVKLPPLQQTLNLYVNDALKYNMRSEQQLFYSIWCFGTADAISFENDGLRIHDLKTGENKCSFKQLEVYAALFCLEYHVPPGEIDIELRIYKSREVDVLEPEVEEIARIMDRIVAYSKLIDKLESERDD